METDNNLHFAVSDLINGVEVSPARVPLGLLGEFQKDVGDFLRGGNREVDLSEVFVGIEDGSFGIAATGLLAAAGLWSDIQHLEVSPQLDSIDPKRAAVIERWQASANKHHDRRYLVKGEYGNIVFFVDHTTNYQLVELWVDVEKYLYGRIVDWGGKTNPNVHLELTNGKSLKIESTQSLIAAQEQNLVYKQALLHVIAEESLASAELRNIKLIAFEQHHPSFNDHEFNLMVKRGTEAWDDLQDASIWLENLRGG